MILDLLVPYPGLHPYNGGFNLASGLLFISCNTQLHKTTFSDIQMLSGFSFILCKSQLLKHLLRHTYAQNKKKGHGINFYVQLPHPYHFKRFIQNHCFHILSFMNTAQNKLVFSTSTFTFAFTFNCSKSIDSGMLQEKVCIQV